MTTTTHFEDRLLAAAAPDRGGEPRPGLAPAAQRAPRRTRLAVAGCGVAAATAAVAIVATSSDVTPSAYAVQPRKDGSVSARIRSLSDAAGLQRSLRAAGVPAVVSYDPAAQMGCAAPGADAGLSTSRSPEPGATSSGRAGVASRSRHASGDPPAGPSHTTGGAIGAGTSDAGPSLSGPGPADDSAASVVTSSWTAGADGATFTLDPVHLKPGDKVYITTSSGTVSSIGCRSARPGGDGRAAPPP